MKSVIICEGNTDLTLIQYFLEKVYQWKHIKNSEYRNYDKKMIQKFDDAENYQWFKHPNGSILCLISAGGVSKIPNMLESVLVINQLGTAINFERIAAISDRDEIETETQFIEQLNHRFNSYNVLFESVIQHNTWNKANYIDDLRGENRFEFLPIIIPFEDVGAIETFLLNALCDASEKEDELKTDKKVIEQCRAFIDNIDCNGKYLSHRREKTKAKFETVFVVMTPAEAFSQRQSILRSIPWENYESIQNGFKKLSELSEVSR